MSKPYQNYIIKIATSYHVLFIGIDSIRGRVHCEKLVPGSDRDKACRKLAKKLRRSTRSDSRTTPLQDTRAKEIPIITYKEMEFKDLNLVKAQDQY